MDRERCSELPLEGEKSRWRTTSVIAVLLALSLWAFAGSLFAHTADDVEHASVASSLGHIKPEAIPPFEPDIFWAKVLSLLDAQNGFIRAQSVDRELSSHLVTTRSNVDGGYFAVDPRPWYGGFGYSLRRIADVHTKNRYNWQSSLGVRWGGFAKGSAQCIDMTMVVRSLEERGGRSLAVDTGRDLSQPNIVRYRMPTGAEMTIGYAEIRDPFRRVDIADACLLDLTIIGVVPTR